MPNPADAVVCGLTRRVGGAVALRTGHVFAGHGGGLLADLILGHEPVVAVEWDAYACAVLRERFPGVRVVEGDVRGVDFARELAGVDALCAGFPCQDISAAGRGRGLAGKRSGLYREVLRAIDAVRPSYVFLENSPRIRTRGRRTICRDLVARGYSYRDGTIAAADVGAPHQRERWWLLARRADADGPRQLQPEGRQPDKRGWAGALGAAVSDAARLGLEVAQPSQAGDQLPAAAGDHRRDGWWSAEPGMGRVAHGLAHRPHRIAGLGNGQVPLCAALAWRLLGGP